MRTKQTKEANRTVMTQGACEIQECKKNTKVTSIIIIYYFLIAYIYVSDPCDLGFSSPKTNKNDFIITPTKNIKMSTFYHKTERTMLLVSQMYDCFIVASLV